MSENSPFDQGRDIEKEERERLSQAVNKHLIAFVQHYYDTNNAGRPDFSQTEVPVKSMDRRIDFHAGEVVNRQAVDIVVARLNQEIEKYDIEQLYLVMAYLSDLGEDDRRGGGFDGLIDVEDESLKTLRLKLIHKLLTISSKDLMVVAPRRLLSFYNALFVRAVSFRVSPEYSKRYPPEQEDMKIKTQKDIEERLEFMKSIIKRVENDLINGKNE